MRRDARYHFLAAVCWLAGACSSESATSSRVGRVGNAPRTGAAAGDSTQGENGQNSPLIAAAGTAAPILQPSAAITPGRGGDSNVCEVVQLVANPQVPDMMIVLDRSGSMQQGGRWAPSVSAVRKITSELQSRIRFGLALFPKDASVSVMAGGANGSFGFSFNNGSGCTPGDIVVPIAAMNAGPIGQELDMTTPDGGTPTAETLMKLLDNFAEMDASPDAQQHPKYVLLVTDGAPTCPNGGGADANPQDIDASNQAIEALTEHMVKTYVIGYDTTTPGNEMLAQVLDGFAQRGGTGDQKHRPVEDEASLTAALESITASIASCSFTLDKAPPRADYVLVTLDGKQLNLDAPDGWRLVDDRTVEIVGSACTTFKSGPHLLDAEVQCMVVQPS